MPTFTATNPSLPNLSISPATTGFTSRAPCERPCSVVAVSAAWQPTTAPRLASVLQPPSRHAATSTSALGLAQEIEVAAVLGLQHVLHVELCVAAARHGDGRPPRRLPCLQLALGHLQLEGSLGDRKPDAIAVAHQRERAAGRGFGRNVQNDRAV